MWATMGCSFLSEVLQLSPGLRSPMALTPTPPWVASGNVAGLENEAVEQAAENPLSGGEAEPAPKKIKRVRLQLDARIELTNEELKVSKFSCYGPSGVRRTRHCVPDSAGAIYRRSGSHPPFNRGQETRERRSSSYFSNAIRCPANL
jgi:hypothetical protein